MQFTISRPGNDLTVNISNFCSDQHGVTIKGWAAAKSGPPTGLEFILGETSAPVTEWQERDDLAEKQPPGTQAWGFLCYLPTSTASEVTFRLRDERVLFERAVKLKPKPGKLPTWHQPAAVSPFTLFLEETNRKGGSVLEIGSRQVCIGGKTKRKLFPNATYTGFDYYKDENTDVTGDAHHLSRYFDGKKFDSVFSLAVFEHLAMPWLAAMEINRVLNVGGLTFHATHFAFPVHERPWDFWRYTDQALRVLFSPPMGFEVIHAGFETPARMHPDKPTGHLLHLPFETVWVAVSVLARKVAEVDTSRFVWDVSVHECLGQASKYPDPKTASS